MPGLNQNIQQIMHYNLKYTPIFLYLQLLVKMFKVISFFLLLACSLAESNAQYDNYERQLLKVVNSMQNGITGMVATANQALSSGSFFSSSQSLTVQIQTDALTSIRNQISSTLSNATIPFALKTWNCTAVSQNEFNNIVSLNNQLQTNQRSFSDNLKALSNYSSCPQVDQMNTQGKLLEQQVKIMQNQISQFCVSNGSGNTGVPPLNPSQNQSGSNAGGANGSSANGSSTNGTNNVPQVYVNNLDNGVNNWVYGNINPQVFYAQVNKKLGSGAKLCPSQNPYIDDSNNCISCPILYNVAAKRCASCPSGSSLNQKIHQCDTSSGETIIKNSNTAASNFIGNVPTPISNLSSCPNQSPYFDGNQCIACLLPNYFDYTNSVCLTCGFGQQFDVSSKICKPLNNSVNPQFSKFNSNLASNVVNYAGTPPKNMNGVESCPNAQPYFNGMNCISCTLPLFFNFSSQVCSACDTSLMFDTNTKTCVVDLSKIYYSNSLNGVANYIGTPPILASTPNKIIRSCPPETPFSNGKQCIQCTSPSFYNFQTNQCEKCSNNLVFSPETKSCTGKPSTGPSTSKNSNVEKVSNFMYAMPQYNDTLLTCDSNAPYFNGAACIACNLPSYFNFKSFNCQTCPPDQAFNVQNRLCQFVNQKFISDTNNENIYFNGNYQAFASALSAKRQGDKSIQVCPSNAPFFQTTTNQCISCPSDQPIFNIKYSRCISCGSDSSFDPSSRICIYNKKVGLKLERTLMNTFSL